MENDSQLSIQSINKCDIQDQQYIQEQFKEQYQQTIQNEDFKQILINIQQEYPQLRYYQHEAIASFIYNDNYGIINLFCGLGKSKISYAIVDQMIKQGKQSFLLVFPANLLDQYFNEFGQKFIDQNIQVLFMKSGENSKTIKILEKYQFDDEQLSDMDIEENIEEDITENKEDDKEDDITYDSLQDSIQDQSQRIIILSSYDSVHLLEKYYDKFSFVMLDECHHAFSEKRLFLQDRKENMLKLTATMHKQENEDESDNNQIVFTYPLQEAIEKGYLCDYQVTVQMFIQGSENERFQKRMLYMKNKMEKNNETHGIVYCRYTDKEHEILSNTKEMCKYDLGANIQVRAVSSKMSDNEKNDNMKWFKEQPDIQNKNIKILCNVNILNEGVDIPQISTLMIQDPKYSFIQIIQNIGRAMRPYCIKNNDGEIVYKKNLANIIIPMDSFTEEEKTILQKDDEPWSKDMDKKFKKLLKILQSLKKIDGRISEDNLFAKCNFECDWLKSDRIQKIVKKITQNKINSYWDKIEQSQQFICMNDRKPNRDSDDIKEQQLANFLKTCNRYYKKNIYIMANIHIRIHYEQFIKKNQYYMVQQCTNRTIQQWQSKLKELEDFVILKQRAPQYNIQQEKKLSIWYQNQNQHKMKKIGLMKSADIQQMWDNFQEKYNIQFKKKSNLNDKLSQIQQYIDKYYELPRQPSKMSIFFGVTMEKLKKNTLTQDQKKSVQEFIDKNYFLKGQKRTARTLFKKKNQLRDFINEKNRFPNRGEEQYKIIQYFNKKKSGYLSPISKKIMDQILTDYKCLQDDHNKIDIYEKIINFIREKKMKPRYFSKNQDEKFIFSQMNCLILRRNPDTVEKMYIKKIQETLNQNLCKNNHFKKFVEMLNRFIKYLNSYNFRSFKFQDHCEDLKKWYQKQWQSYLRNEGHFEDRDISQKWEELVQKKNISFYCKQQSNIVKQFIRLFKQQNDLYNKKQQIYLQFILNKKDIYDVDLIFFRQQIIHSKEKKNNQYQEYIQQRVDLFNDNQPEGNYVQLFQYPLDNNEISKSMRIQKQTDVLQNTDNVQIQNIQDKIQEKLFQILEKQCVKQCSVQKVLYDLKYLSIIRLNSLYYNIDKYQHMPNLLELVLKRFI